MTIEESIKKDPSKFQAIVDAKAPEVRAAMQDLSVKLDAIFNGAIKEYCEAEGVEADIAAIPTYKTMNKIITGKLDRMIGEHVKEKRKDLLRMGRGVEMLSGVFFHFWNLSRAYFSCIICLAFLIMVMLHVKEDQYDQDFSGK